MSVNTPSTTISLAPTSDPADTDTATASSTASSSHTAGNGIQQTEFAHAADSLQDLGVTALDNQTFETTVINSAIAEDEKLRAKQQQKQQQRNGRAAIPKRAKIPKKAISSNAATTTDAESATSHRIVHDADELIANDDDEQPSAYNGSIASTNKLRPAKAFNPRMPAHRPSSIADDKAAGNTRVRLSATQLTEQELAERQRRIELGEITPFEQLNGMSKGFRRVAPKRQAEPEASSSSTSSSSSSLQPPSAASKLSRRVPSPAPSLPTSDSDVDASATKSPPPTARARKRLKQSPTTSAVKREVIDLEHSTSSDDSTAAAPVPAASNRCKGGCGFFGNPATAGYCSKCYKERDRIEAEQEALNAKLPPKTADSIGQAELSSDEAEDASDFARDFYNNKSATNRRTRRPAAKTRVKATKVKAESDSSDEEYSNTGRRVRKAAKRRVKVEDDDDEEYNPDDDPVAADDDLDDDDTETDAVGRHSVSNEVDELSDDVEPDVILPARKLHANNYYDDYDDWIYNERIQAVIAGERIVKVKQEKTSASNGHTHDAATAASDEPEDDVAFDGGLVIPSKLWNRLFGYQRTGVQWLWELHTQETGGIIADEMGLGKTIQVLAFLAGLHYTNTSHCKLGPTLIVVPATIIRQWVRELQTWYPRMRVIVLHDSAGHFSATATNADIVAKAYKTSSILITSYTTLRLQQDIILPRQWGYVILDEGHRLKNPDAAITLVCKQLLTVHRLILTGSPIQNNLIELWSLFDFVFPGKLGTLPVFEEEFVWPINQGGYTHASPIAVQTAYKCAMVLKDLITPYILRRSKQDISSHLPKKTEQILFCQLTPAQVDEYRKILDTGIVSSILDGRTSLFQAIHQLRKIVNHPDLLKLAELNQPNEKPRNPFTSIIDYGTVAKSGKLLVLRQILKLWHAAGHRCLIFSQTRQVLDIIEAMVHEESYSYRRLDGSTTVKSRIPLIDEYNGDRSIFAMLLTTKAGGLGVNLVGADRVVIFDPDWNPSTDAQARERAFRIGQTRDVTIYRLVTRGTVEEKIYQRQVFKNFLSNKILRDPNQRRFFSAHDMKDLFAFDDGGVGGTGKYIKQKAGNKQAADNQLLPETANIFGDVDFQDRQSLQEAESKLETAGYEVKTENGSEPAVKDEATSNGDNSDNKILSMLFSEGLQSAMSHDAILSQGTSMERKSLEQRAEKLATRAVAALKQSQQSMSGSSINAPTWTGRHGVAGVDGSQAVSSLSDQFDLSTIATGRKFGQITLRSSAPAVSSSGIGSNALASGSERNVRSVQSDELKEGAAKAGQFGSSSKLTESNGEATDSAAVFAAIRQRQQQQQQQQAAKDSDPTVVATNALLSQLHTLLSSAPQGLPSGQLISRFNDQLKSAQDKLVFRNMLRSLAKLNKKEGKWHLKAEFK